jgi:hypothetical protein
VEGVYVKFPMCNAQFHPSVPQGKNLVIDAKVLAHQLDEIGILGGKISSNPFTRWSFIFPLRNFQNQKDYMKHLGNVSVCPLFGRVVSCSHQMVECVTKLSSTKGTERSGFTITLESQ